MDGLKRLNDSHGHAAGDEVLRAIGAHLSQRLRAVDASGRVGGDEFAVVLAETDLDGARRVFDDVQRGVSVGVVAFTAPPPSVDHALAAADALMYRAKRAGGRRIACENSHATQRPPGWRSSGRSHRIEPRAEVAVLADGPD